MSDGADGGGASGEDGEWSSDGDDSNEDGGGGEVKMMILTVKITGKMIRSGSYMVMLCARQCFKYCTYINAFTFSSKSKKLASILSPFCSWEHCSIERLNNLPKVMQLVTDSVKIQTIYTSLRI